MNGYTVPLPFTFTLDDTECYAKFSELPILLMFEFRCRPTLCLHRKSKFH